MKAALALILAIFLVTLLIRLPAAWVLPLLPRSVQCLEPEGSIWNGYCGELRVDTIAVSNIHWQLAAAPLLRARARVALQSDDRRMSGHGVAIFDLNGELQVQALQVQMPLEAGLPFLPSGWSGSGQLDIAAARLRHGRLLAVRGRALIQELHQQSLGFGNIELDFPGSAPADAAAAQTSSAAAISGELRDRGGPLALVGTLRLQPDGAYEINGTVATRAGADEQLQHTIELLGPPDAQGRRTFSVAGAL
ncbi:MAG: type II secretion system protein N [Steroidobacterales bacterium]